MINYLQLKQKKRVRNKKKQQSYNRGRLHKHWTGKLVTNELVKCALVTELLVTGWMLVQKKYSQLFAWHWAQFYKVHSSGARVVALVK
jgi:hypothetical protein